MQQLFIFQGTFLSFWERNSGWPKLQDKVRKIPAANTDSLKFILALIKKNMWIALFFPLIGKINIILHMQMTSAEQSIWDKHTNVSVMYHPSSTHWRELFFFHFLVVCLYYWLYASQSKHETNCLSNLNNKHLKYFICLGKNSHFWPLLCVDWVDWHEKHFKWLLWLMVFGSPHY